MAELFLKRKLSFPVSRMWQRWVRRSSSAVVIFGVAEHGSPLAEAEIGGDDDAGGLIELAQQMEEQGSAGGVERQVVKLVEDNEIGVGEPGGDLSWLALKLLLFKSVDEFDGGEEPHALAMVLDGLDADRRGEMCLACAGAGDQDDIVRILQDLAAMQLTRERLVDLARQAKSKPARSR